MKHGRAYPMVQNAGKPRRGPPFNGTPAGINRSDVMACGNDGPRIKGTIRPACCRLMSGQTGESTVSHEGGSDAIGKAVNAQHDSHADQNPLSDLQRVESKPQRSTCGRGRDWWSGCPFAGRMNDNGEHNRRHVGDFGGSLQEILRRTAVSSQGPVAEATAAIAVIFRRRRFLIARTRIARTRIGIRRLFSRVVLAAGAAGNLFFFWRTVNPAAPQTTVRADQQ